MKKIEAVIRRTRFEETKEALLENGVEWFSYVDVRGLGPRPATAASTAA